MTKAYLGVDAGATKSHALLASEGGQFLGLGASGSGNPESVGQEGFASASETALSQALETAGMNRAQITGAGFGVAGYDWPSQREEMLTTIGLLDLNCPIELVNDSLIALMAGASRGWGVAVVAGTSCNAWGIDPEGRYGRMAGFSHLGEYAGSGEIVAKALQEVTKAWSMRGPRTMLTQAFIDLVGVENEDELIEGISLKACKIGPAAAPLVFEVAKQGDPVAQGLVRWAGAELADLALGIIRQLNLFDEQFEIVLAGSFYRGSPVVQQEMERIVHEVAPGARFVPLMVPPVIGGVLLGMRGAGVPTSSMAQAREKLIDEFATINIPGLAR